MPLTLQCSNHDVQVRLARAASIDGASGVFVAADGRLGRRQAGRRLTVEEVDRLVAAHAAGATAGALGREFGVHRSTVVLHLRRRGVPAAVQPRMGDDEVAEAARLCEAGLTMAEVSATLGWSATAIRRRLLAHEKGLDDRVVNP